MLGTMGDNDEHVSDDEHFDEDEDDSGAGGGAGKTSKFLQYRPFAHTRVRTDRDKSPDQGRWSREEHDAFMEGLTTYGREWKKIAAMIPSRTVVQIRTHAQKYFQKIKKSDVKGSNHPSSRRNTNDLRIISATPSAAEFPSAAGEATPRAVAAASILLVPRNLEWMRQQSNAMEVLERRRTSPRLHLPPTDWPQQRDTEKAKGTTPPNEEGTSDMRNEDNENQDTASALSNGDKPEHD